MAKPIGIKGVGIILALMFCTACSPDPMVSGKKLSDWINQLSDSDPKFKMEALTAISSVPKEEAGRARKPLGQLTICSNF